MRHRFSSEVQDAPEVKIFSHEKNKGKGTALSTGFSNATGNILIIQDADLEYDPPEYHSLIKAIEEDFADIVYGARFKSD